MKAVLNINGISKVNACSPALPNHWLLLVNNSVFGKTSDRKCPKRVDVRFVTSSVVEWSSKLIAQYLLLGL